MAGSKPIQALTINARCRDCTHFTGVAHPKLGSAGENCATKGILGAAKPCKYFQIDPRSIKFDQNTTEGEYIRMLTDIVRGMSDRSLSQVAAVLNQESKTRAQGLRFGEQIYFALGNVNYLSNFVSGRVVKADSEYVFIRGESRTVAQIKKEHVFDQEGWERHRKKLRKSSRYLDPSSGSGIISQTLKDLRRSDHEPPNIADLAVSKLQGYGVSKEHTNGTGRPGRRPNGKPLEGAVTLRGGKAGKRGKKQAEATA